jgi:TolA-binding protein
MRYMKEVNQALREGTSGKKAKVEEQISYQSGNETIIQPKYLKETSIFGTIINMVIGIAIGVAITWFLVVPGIQRDIQNQAREEVLEANTTISSKNQTISSLESQIADMESQVEAARSNEAGVENKLESYEQLLKAYTAYNSKNIESAAATLESVNTEDLGTEAKNIYDAITVGVDEEYMETLYQTGYAAYNTGDYATAIEDLRRVVDADESYDIGNALFYLAQSYQESGDSESALPLYQRFVELYPGTQRAGVAQTFLNGTTTEQAE